MEKRILDEIINKHKLWLDGRPGGKRADLSYADLSYFNLIDVDFRHADLSFANFANSDLCFSNFIRAKLTGAVFTDANIRYVIGNGKELFTIQTNHVPIVIAEKVIAVGLEQHSVEEWENFSDNEIAKMNEKALEFWRLWKVRIFKFHKEFFKGVK